MINGGPVTISPADAVNSAATGINAQDQIVGTYTDGNLVVHGFLDISGSFSFIDVPQGGRRVPSTSITGLNDQGRITGNYLDNQNRFHGFLFNVNGFSYVDIPGATDTHVNGINNLNQFVGSYTDTHGL